MIYATLRAEGELDAISPPALIMGGTAPRTHVTELLIPTNSDGSAFSYGRIPHQLGLTPGQPATITVERASTGSEVLPSVDAAVYEDASGFYWVAKLANDPRVVESVGLRITVSQ